MILSRDISVRDFTENINDLKTKMINMARINAENPAELEEYIEKVEDMLRL